MNSNRSKQAQKKQTLEIGTVYRQPETGHLFLAASLVVMIRLVPGKVIKVKPSQRWEILRSCSVHDLLKRWKVETHLLDEAMHGFLQPETHRGGNRQHNKGRGPRDQGTLMASYLQIRLHKFARH